MHGERGSGEYGAKKRSRADNDDDDRYRSGTVKREDYAGAYTGAKPVNPPLISILDSIFLTFFKVYYY